jgi:hypothetical protein
MLSTSALGHLHVVCISYSDPLWSCAQLRFLLKAVRLRTGSLIGFSMLGVQ